MKFGILGQLHVENEAGETVGVAAPRLRALLVTLLLNADRVVPKDSLAESVWDGAPPDGAVTTTVRAYAMRLRKALGGGPAARIRTHGPGYLIHVEPDEFDAAVFEALCREAGLAAGAGGRWQQVADTASRALSLWRGTPLIDVPSRVLSDAWVPRFEQQRLQLQEWRIEADLRLGRSDALVPEISTLVQQHPLREPLYRLHMLALAGADRSGEALAVYRNARMILIEQLGVEPSAELQRLHQRILTGAPMLDDAPASTPPAAQVSAPPRAQAARTAAAAISSHTIPVVSLHAPAAAAPNSPAAASTDIPPAVPQQLPGVPQQLPDVPQQLPDTLRSFVGRERELAQLAALSSPGSPAVGAPGDAAMVCVIHGMGGAGKSALAVHAAHRLAGRYPDGQLFVDFRGHTPGVGELGAHAALELLLRSLGVSPTAIPRGLPERAALLRSRLSGVRVLLLLDNVTSAAQVRPLLPPDSGSLVLVTSRNMLSGLDGAHWFSLGELGAAEAVELLRKAAGPRRFESADSPREAGSADSADFAGPAVSADPADFADSADSADSAIAELAELCGRLPLALRIAAAHLRHHRGLSPALYAAQLREVTHRLDMLRDERSTLIAVFDSAVEDLPAPEQWLFRLLGLIPGTDFDVYTAASLADCGLRETERMLESLLGHHLLQQRGPGRYRFHDLVRAYAAERVRSPDSGPAWADQDAWERMFEYYLWMAAEADERLPAMVKRTAAPVHPRTPPTRPLPPLADGTDALGWIRAEQENLLAVIGDARSRGRHDLAVDLIALIGSALRLDGPWPFTVQLYEAAVESAEAIGHRLATADHLVSLGRARQHVGDFAAATQSFERAVELARSAGTEPEPGSDPASASPPSRTEAMAQFFLARSRQAAGQEPAAVAAYERALALYLALGDVRGEADVLTNLGRIMQSNGEMDRSEQAQQRALELFHNLGDRTGEASARWELGRVKARRGDYAGAREALTSALDYYREVGQAQNTAHALWELGRVHLTTGHNQTAQALLEEALAIFKARGYRFGTAYLGYELGRQRLAVGRPTEALALLRRATADFRALGSTSGQANGVHELGRARLALGGRKTAAHLLHRARQLFIAANDPQGAAETFNSSAELEAKYGDAGDALDLHLQALELARSSGSMLDEARALDGAARARSRLGDSARALADQRKAVALYLRMGAAEASSAEARLSAMEH